MGLFTEFQVLFPYIQSVRKLENYLSFDIEFPDTWRLPKKYVNEEKTVENTTSKKGLRSFSFVSEFDETSVDDLIMNIKAIISHNKEREEKERLFEVKIGELKKIFEKSDLDNLQSLKFEFNKTKLTLDDEGDDESTEPNGGSSKLVQERT
jgi:hypothetical protein